MQSAQERTQLDLWTSMLTGYFSTTPWQYKYLFYLIIILICVPGRILRLCKCLSEFFVPSIALSVLGFAITGNSICADVVRMLCTLTVVFAEILVLEVGILSIVLFSRTILIILEKLRSTRPGRVRYFSERSARRVLSELVEEEDNLLERVMIPSLLTAPSKQEHCKVNCSVCMDSWVTHVFVPCGHASTCTMCTLFICSTEEAACPICRCKQQDKANFFAVTLKYASHFGARRVIFAGAED